MMNDITIATKTAGTPHKLTETRHNARQTMGQGLVIKLDNLLALKSLPNKHTVTEMKDTIDAGITRTTKPDIGPTVPTARAGRSSAPTPSGPK